MSAAPLSAVGFRAQLSGASLWDLVQMECQARSRLVVRVTGEGGIGYLYFARGRVVHAVAPQRIGEAAALEILGWTNGLYQPCERAWPATETIDTPCEVLILEVAKRRDEGGASNLFAFPSRAEAAEAGELMIEEGEIVELEEEGMADMRSPNVDQPALAVPLGRSEMTADFPVVLRLSASGTIVKNKGGNEELAGVVAYAHRLVQLAGELLGLDSSFLAMECSFTEGRCLIFTEENGDMVALRPRPDMNLQPLREKLGL
jgi:hypothetical protein